MYSTRTSIHDDYECICGQMSINPFTQLHILPSHWQTGQAVRQRPVREDIVHRQIIATQLGQETC